MNLVKILKRKPRRSAATKAHTIAGPRLESLEERTLMSATPALSELLAALSYTNSDAILALPGDPNLGTDSVTPSTTNSTPLINLTTFRADALFAGIDGSGFSTVIIDTGIDLNHPFFGPDADGNGVADRIVYQWDFADNDGNASDANNHGSNVASIAASSDSVYTGMAPAANIIVLKVFKDTGSGTFGYVENALKWIVANAAAYNIASVNLSLGDEQNYANSVSLYGMGDELAALEAMDVIVVAAAGNRYSGAQGVSYPAADPHIVGVGAVNSSGTGTTVASFSQRDDTLTDIFAPGTSIVGANRNGGTVTMSGTSQASPHIAGLAVLAQELAMQELGRRLTADEFVELLQSTGVDFVDSATGLSLTRVDAYAMGLGIINATPQGNGTGEIHGAVWNDLDADGTRDAGEPGLDNWTVYLDDNENGQRDPGEQIAFTAPDGSYAFTGLAAGTYHVAQILSDNAVQTSPGQGGNDFLSLVAHWSDTQVHEDGSITPSHEEEPPVGGSGQQWADVWAEGDYAYLGHYTADSSVDIVDMQDLDHLHLAARWTAPAPGLQFADVQVVGDIAYFGSDNGGGVYIVDVSNPHHPVTLSHVTSSIGAHTRVHTLYVDGDYLYEADSRSSVIKVINISNPASPQFVRDIVSPSGGPVHEVTVRNGRLYTAVINSSGRAEIFDVTNIGTTPATYLGTTPSAPFAHTAWSSEDGTLLAVAREVGAGDVRLYNITNPASPVLLSTISGAAYGIQGYTPHQPMIVGDRLYVAWYQAGTVAFDISNPANPVLLGSYDTYPGTASNYNGNWGVFALDGPDRILAIDMHSGLYILSAAESRQHVVTVTTGAVNNIDFGVSIPEVTIIDDGDPGFSTVGEWTTWTGQGHNGDIRQGVPSSGADVAKWTFNVEPGVYRVSATWTSNVNRATNAPYSVLDGTTLLSTYSINQQGSPAGTVDEGSTWQALGDTFNISGSALVVTLSNLANGKLNADAIRIERVGDLMQGPEIAVSVDGVNIPDDVGGVAFGTVGVGTQLEKTFTVTNTGTQILQLQGPISLPPGFTLSQSFSSTTLAAGASTTFKIRLDTAAAGSFSGPVSFGSSDADEGVFNFTITGEVQAAAVTQILDDGDAGFTTVGEWSTWTGQGRGSDIRQSNPGTGADTARWSFQVAPGVYRVWVTWTSNTNRATNAPFSVLDGSTVLSTVAVNQQLNPAGLTDAGSNWKPLGGTFSITGTTLAVVLSDLANGKLNADAVRIERVGDLAQGPEIAVSVDGANVPDNTGSISFGTTPVNTGVEKTFTVTNLGTQSLQLTGPISVPAGFTLTESFSATTVAPGATATFKVRLTAAAAGSFSGSVSFGTNDVDEGTFNFTVSGVVQAVQSVQIVDDGDAAFTTVGEWSTWTGQGRGSDIRQSNPGTGADTARWAFQVTPGVYRVWVTWTSHTNRATNAPFSVLDGSTVLSTVAVNQQVNPTGLTDAGSNWQPLGGTFNITGATLAVVLSDLANGKLNADAVRIERVGDLSPAAIASAQQPANLAQPDPLGAALLLDHLLTQAKARGSQPALLNASILEMNAMMQFQLGPAATMI